LKKKTFISVLKEKMAKVTFAKISKLALKNANNNYKFLKYGNSIKQLHNFNFNKGDISIVVCGGPSLKRNNQIKTLKKYKDKAVIIAADGSLFYLLRNNIVPDLVVTLDPHPTRIVRWFGDEKLSRKKIKSDDYFSRQDLDPAFKNELKANKKIIKLIDKFANKLNIAVCTSSSSLVVKRLINTGSKLFWWNPTLDNPEKKNSLSRKLYFKNKLPLINAGGNVGSAAWMIADSVICSKKIALLGMDFGYYLNTPYENTQYYDGVMKIAKKKDLSIFYKKIYNPILKKYFFTDHAYLWYRDIFLEMLKIASSKTINCTGGGILFGKKIGWSSLNNFCKLSFK